MRCGIIISGISWRQTEKGQKGKKYEQKSQMCSIEFQGQYLDSRKHKVL